MKYIFISLLWITCLCGSIFNRVHIRKSLKSSGVEAKIATLNQEQRLQSPNGKYYVNMQQDGNLVLYSTKAFNNKGKDNPIWNSNTMGQGKGPYKATMQTDGNFVVYDSTNKPTWNSQTNGKGKGPYKVTVQDDGNFVLYESNGKPIWDSKTNGKSRRRRFI
jgi:hypothetical protein